jgi:uncharacterized protein (DUF433 family)
MAATPRTAEKPKKAPPKGQPVPGFPRLTVHRDRMGGMACIRDYRFTAAEALRLLSAGHSEDEILTSYPFLERADLREALSYASHLAEKHNAPSGIFLPDGAKEPPLKGKKIRGRGRVKVTKGERVQFGAYAGTLVRDSDGNPMVLKIEDISDILE